MVLKLQTASNKDHALLWALMRWFFLLMVASLSLTWADPDPFHHEANAQHSNETAILIEERAGYFMHQIPCQPNGHWGQHRDLICDAVCHPFVGDCRTEHWSPSTGEHFCQCSLEIAVTQNPCEYGDVDHCYQLCTTMSFMGGICIGAPESQCRCVVTGDHGATRLPLKDAIERAQGDALCSTAYDGQVHPHCFWACPNGVPGHCTSESDRMSIHTCKCDVAQRRAAGVYNAPLPEANSRYPPSSDPCSRRGLNDEDRSHACRAICPRGGHVGMCAALAEEVGNEGYCFCSSLHDHSLRAPREIMIGNWEPREGASTRATIIEGYIDPCVGEQRLSVPQQAECQAMCPQGTQGNCWRLMDEPLHLPGHCFCQFRRAMRLFTLYTAWEMVRDGHLSNGQQGS